jgi:hypothetical protein
MGPYLNTCDHFGCGVSLDAANGELHWHIGVVGERMSRTLDSSSYFVTGRDVDLADYFAQHVAAPNAAGAECVHAQSELRFGGQAGSNFFLQLTECTIDLHGVCIRSFD